MTTEPGETYLGDGLYASMENGQVKLRAPRDEGDHVVYLEWNVWVALKRFVEGPRRESADDQHAA